MCQLKDGKNPRSIELNTMDLWVQVYDLKIGFITKRIITEMGNHIGQFVTSCLSNFAGVWRDYL